MSSIFDTNTYKKARGFIYRNARPICLAQWNYHFEGEKKEEVLKALSFYQNIDGGFGYGLEADSFNPNSNPVQTWYALNIIQSLGGIDPNSPMIKAVLYYLANSKDFDGDFWHAVTPSNNDYPHAPWWHYNANYEPGYNPTAGLAGFYIAYGDKNDKFYNKALKITKAAIKYFMVLDVVEIHLLNNYIELYNYVNNIINLPDDFFNKFKYHVNKNIEYNISLWNTYVTKPSMYIKNMQFYQGNEEIVAKECEYILSTQLKNGAWDISWRWNNYPEDFAISKLYWQCETALNNILFLKNFYEV
ncbi:MAG: hypothetical protein GYA87_07085 [Christensenellaceae bacterium]|nr:hypothetical protein [Christensenellaceae bacterium]